MHKTENSRRNVIYVIAFVDLSLPPATKLGQGYVFTGVCDSVNSGGCLPQCMLGYHTPSGSRPPGADTPPKVDTAWEQTPPQFLFAIFFGFFGIFWHFLAFFPFFFPFFQKF